MLFLQIDSTKLSNSSTPGEGVLANFFNSLLHKKSNQSPVLTKTTGKCTSLLLNKLLEYSFNNFLFGH